MRKRSCLIALCLGAVVSACPGGGSRRPVSPEQRVLTVRTEGPGKVVSEPPGIYCGSTCSAKFDRGTVVTLWAKHGDDAKFSGWQGPCEGRGVCRVSMDTDQSVTASWGERDPVPLEDPVDANRANGGDPGGGGDGWGEGGGDRDGDGISNAVDSCPDDPEDLDGFEDADGCPDMDNDADGIADVDDLCPNAGEDRDLFEDEDGCPEPDNDRDGILDFDDQCPNQPETMNGLYDDDGCPDRIP